MAGRSCDGCEEDAGHENDTVEVAITEHVAADDRRAAIRDPGYDVAS